MCCATVRLLQAYVAQISYLLFLKMDEERVDLIGEPSLLPAGSRWGDFRSFRARPGGGIRKAARTLSRQSGVIGAIFLKAQNEIQDPARLKRLVQMIDEETWMGLSASM